LFAFTNNNYIHSHQIYVDKDKNVRLKSNLYTRSGDSTRNVNKQLETVRWTCPEKAQNPHLPSSKASDIYRYTTITHN